MTGLLTAAPETAHGLLNKRQAIMQAALRIFVPDGYAAATLEEIAVAAGVSKQTVYNHFGDKETLFLAVTDAALSRAAEELRAATDAFPIQTTRLRADLVTFARNVVDCFLQPETSALRRLAFAEVHRYPQLLSEWRQRTERIRITLAGHFARLESAGRLEVHDPERAARQFLTLVTAPAWQLSDLGTVPTDDDLYQVIAENVDLFLAAYARPVDRESQAHRR